MSKQPIDFEAAERQRDKRLRRRLLETLQLSRGHSPAGGISGQRLVDYTQSALPGDQHFDDDEHALRLLQDLKNRGYVEIKTDLLRRGERFSLRHVQLARITAKGSDLCDEAIAPDPVIDDDRVAEGQG